MKQEEQRQVFNDWLAGYRALLFKVIRAYAFTTEDQNDLFQETCLQMYRSIPNFRGTAKVSTWLYRIALNVAIKWSTQEKKHEGHYEVGTMEYVLEATTEPDNERINWLYDQIKHLNEIDRSLTLLLLEGYSYKEMAKMVGVSETNIGVKLHRIKKQLVNNSKQYSYGD